MADLIRGRLPPPVPGAVGLTPGRSGSGVRTWFAQQSPAFRAGIELVAIDPLAPYACGIRAALPHARIAVNWPLMLLANDMLTQVRQRVARENHGRREARPTRCRCPAGCY